MSEPPRTFHDEVFTEALKAIVPAGAAARTSALLINGGAAVAMLAFLGAILQNASGPGLSRWSIGALSSFAIGVLGAAVSDGTNYMTQARFSSRWNRASLVLVGSAYIAFLSGVTTAALGFLDLDDRRESVVHSACPQVPTISSAPSPMSP